MMWRVEVHHDGTVDYLTLGGGSVYSTIEEAAAAYAEAHAIHPMVTYKIAPHQCSCPSESAVADLRDMLLKAYAQRDEAYTQRDEANRQREEALASALRTDTMRSDVENACAYSVAALAARDEAVAKVAELSAQVETQLKALGICDQWIRERDSAIAGLKSELTLRTASLETRLVDGEEVRRDFVFQLTAKRRTQLLSRFFPNHVDADSPHERVARAARLLEELRAVESERDCLRGEVEALRAAAVEADLANYKDERPALYEEVARLRGLVEERDAALLALLSETASTGFDPGQLLWNELHEGDSTTTWSTTTADRERYARAENFVRRWGYLDMHTDRARLMEQIAELREQLMASGGEVGRLRCAFSEQELKIANLTDIANRRPLMSSDEAALRAEIERLRAALGENIAARAGAPTPAGKRVWACKAVWGIESELPAGADQPMREAVKDAFFKLTGRWPDTLFSGWGGQLTDAELRCAKENEGRQAQYSTEASRH